MKRYSRALTLEELAKESDENIDYSDSEERDDSFFREATLIEPDKTEQITIRVRRSVLAHFRAQGRGYQTRIDRVLERYVRAQRGFG